MSKFPGWRTMTGVQRRNAKMEDMFETARKQGHTGLHSGTPLPFKPNSFVLLTRDVYANDGVTRYRAGTLCTFRGASSLKPGQALLEVFNPKRSDSFQAPPDAFKPA